MSAAAETDWLAGADAPAPRESRAKVGRMRKIACDGCGAILYGSARTLRNGLPLCGCGGTFTLPNLRDRAAVEPETLEAELTAMGRDAYNAAARVIGWPQWAAAKRERRSGAAPARCQWEGGYCVKFTAAKFCPEHDPAEIRRRAAA